MAMLMHQFSDREVSYLLHHLFAPVTPIMTGGKLTESPNRYTSPIRGSQQSAFKAGGKLLADCCYL